jgi:hypothetical protein
MAQRMVSPSRRVGASDPPASADVQVRDRFNLGSQGQPDWIDRARVCIQMICKLIEAPDAPRDLADIGCGDQKLGAMLARRGLPLTFIGYDLVPQAANVVRFDLSCDRLQQAAGIVTLLGVIEYLSDLTSALTPLSASCRYLIVSHVLRTEKSPSPQRVAELGWRTHLTRQEFETAVRSAHFELLEGRMTPDDRTLVLCCRSAASRRA